MSIFNPVPSPATSTTAAAARAEFLRLCDVAIGEAERQRRISITAGQEWRVKNMDWLLGTLTAYRTAAQRGSLPPSAGATLGLSRFASEYNEVDELADPLYALDRVYTTYL